MMVNYNSRFSLRVASRILDHNDEMDTVSLGLKFEIWKSVQNVYKFTFLIGKCQNRACHTIQRHLPT